MAQTYTDTNVNSLTINKLTKQEYDNLQQVSENELWLVEEQVDSTVTQGSTNPVQSGAVYEALQDIGGTNDIVMCKMLENKALASYATPITRFKYIEDHGWVDMDRSDIQYNEGTGEWTGTFVSLDIAEGEYYYDMDNDTVFVADENSEMQDVTSTVVIQGDTYKLYVDITTNKAYRYDGSNFVPVCESEKEIVDNLIIAKDDSNNCYAYPLVNTYIGLVNSTTPASFLDTKTSSLHTFTAEDSGKYFYDTVDNKVYVYITHNNSLYCCSDDGALYHLEDLDTTKTYLSYNTKILYHTDNGEEFTPINSEVKFADESGTYSDLPAAADNIQSGWTLSALFARIKKWFESLKKVAFSGSYNDLTDKPQNATTTTAGLMSAEDKLRLTIPNFSNYTSLRSLIEYLIGQGNYFYRFSCSTSDVSTGLPVYTQEGILFFVEYTCRPSTSNAVNITARINGRDYNLYVGCFYRNEAAGVEATWKRILATNI